MKRLLYMWLLAALMCCGVRPLGAQTEEQGRILLDRVAASFRELGDYEVRFTVFAGDDRAEGEYAVAGEAYYLKMGMAEVFCDGRLRHEVDHRRREVVINGVDPRSRNILDNPAHVFDLWAEHYRAVPEAPEGDLVRIALTPRDEADAADGGSVTLTVDCRTARPQQLAYDYDSERIVIRFDRVGKAGAPIPKFDRKAFSDYETIDFR